MDALMGKILFGVNRVGSGSHGCRQDLKQGVPSFMKLSGGEQTGGIPVGAGSRFPDHSAAVYAFPCAQPLISRHGLFSCSAAELHPCSGRLDSNQWR